MPEKYRKKIQKYFLWKIYSYENPRFCKLKMSKFSTKNILDFFFCIFQAFFIILDDLKQFPRKKIFFHFFEKNHLGPPFGFFWVTISEGFVRYHMDRVSFIVIHIRVGYCQSNIFRGNSARRSDF